MMMRMADCISGYYDSMMIIDDESARILHYSILNTLFIVIPVLFIPW
jgi:hypothetical protein